MKRDHKKLELDKVLALLSEQAWSEGCRRDITGIEPLTDIDKIKEEITKTADAFTMSSKLGTPRFSNIKDMREAVKRAEQGGTLSLRELLDVAAVLRVIGIIARWREQWEADNSLSYLFSQLMPNKRLLEKIDNAIVSEEELSDNASPELSRIRRAVIRQGSLIKEQLDKLIRNRDAQKFLQESIVTMRDGRYVVPVKTEYRSEIQGLLHDTSSSGATLFIEPMNVVEANNEIRLLKGQEQAEIERIIAELSAETAEFSEPFACGYKAVIRLEMCFAKANLGAKMRAVVPKIADKPLIELRKARHPLISSDVVVPVTITLGGEFGYTCLIVTGPNTGGKTVAIKTAGLLVLMAQCGLMLPVADGSRVGVFKDIFADIGDEQSIEQSLSTFSSHMNNIIGIMDKAEENTLTLLDELGSGTDPVEGSALAVSVLEFLKSAGGLVIGTTHYQEVKMFAIETDGVENACCEFDVATLRPTYNLVIGAPGKSNAFAIAGRLGMREDVIRQAQTLISGENRRFEEVVEALEANRREVEELKNTIAEEERKSRALTGEINEQKRRFEQAREKEMQAARQRALSIVEEVRKNADLLLDELEALRQERDKADFSEKVRGIRSRVNASLNKLHDDANPVENSAAGTPYKLPRPLKPYDTVLLADIDKKGTLIQMPDSSGTCFVQVGLIKTKTNAANLRLVEEERVKLNGKPVSKTSVVVKKGDTGTSVRGSGLELDIRGFTVDAGVNATDKFIDESIMNGLHQVTIIHGKGTGALRQAVHEFLRRHKQVKSFRLGVYGEGEDGVTVVVIGD